MSVASATTTTHWAALFGQALRGAVCHVHGAGPDALRLPTDAWRRRADDSDAALLRRCTDLTLDVGCGPGRMGQGLLRTGKQALGIDVVAEAVAQTRRRGVPALQRDVYEVLPGEGSWGTVLLADGNIGIGGDPVRLLRRVHALLDDAGRAVVDLGRPGTGLTTRHLRLECRGRHSEPFAWTWVGAEVIGGLARAAGFGAVDVQCHEGRWFGVLRQPHR